MFMTGCVVLVMSSCHDKDTDRLWCIGLCQDVIKTSQTMSYLHYKMSLLSEWHLMTAVINMHTTSFIFITRHVMIIKVSC